MKNLYATGCDGIFFVFGNRKVDLRNTGPDNPKPVADDLADRLLSDFEGKFVFEVKEGEKVEEPTIEKYVPGVTPFVFDWENMPMSEIPTDIVDLGYEDKEWNFDTAIDKRTNKEIEVVLDGKAFMYEMDFIECNTDVDKDTFDETPKDIEKFLEKFKDEDPKDFKGMKDYKELTLEEELALSYNPKKKYCIKHGYKAQDGLTMPELDEFLKNRKA